MLKKYIILLFVSLVLMTSDRVIGFSSVKTVLQIPLMPISYGLYNVGYTVNGLIKFVVSLPSVYQENVEMEGKVKDLEESLVRFDDLLSENKALRQQLNIAGERNSKEVMASVIGIDDSKGSVLLLIDKGARDGLEEDMVAVQGKSLIGRITKVNRVSSYVLPIMSTQSKVPVKVLTGGDKIVKGLLVGELNKNIVLTEVLQRDEIRSGDLIVVSGEGGVYPAGLLVGRVNEIVSKDNELFKKATVEPVWTLESLRTVFVDIK